MAEKTKRGEEERQREDETMRGQPVEKTLAEQGEATATIITRDKHIPPSADSQREGHAQSK